MDPSSIVKEMTGDILDTPADSVILHSCNCEGKWGAGVADVLRRKFPFAFKVYRQYCLAQKGQWKDILGTALLVPPQPGDAAFSRPRWIGCLFTKAGPGKPIEPFGHVDIYEATKMALDDLVKKLHTVPPDSIIGGLYCPLINAGIFAVPWSVTRQLLQESGLPITVLILPRGEMALHTNAEATREFVEQVRKQRQRHGYNERIQ